MPFALEISAAAPARPPFDASVAAAERARDRGMAALWWADHLLHWFPPSLWTPDLTPAAASVPSPHTWFDPFAMAAAVGQRVDGIRLGVGVTDTVRRHPAALAQTALTLDHITKGRFILGVGAGEALNLTPLGIENRRATSRLAESLEVMRLLLGTSDEVDYEGEHITLRGAAVGLRPYGDAPPPVWVAAHGPRGLELTGRFGDGWLPFCTDPAEYRRMWAAVRTAATAAGRPDAVTPGLYARVVLAADDDAARTAVAASVLMRFIALTAPASTYARHGAEHPIGEGLAGITRFLPTGLGRTEALALADRVPGEVACATVVAGSPATVAARLGEMTDAGARHIQVVDMTGLAAPALAADSPALLGEALTALRSRKVIV